MKQHLLTSLAPGKLILLGEYAVLEGAPALVAAVNRFARVSISPASGDSFSVSSPTLGIPALAFKPVAGGKIAFDRAAQISRQQLAFFAAAIETFFQESHPEISPAHIELDTGDFFNSGSSEKLGFGSSAALSIALLHAIHTHANAPLSDQYALFQQALRAHYRAQGKLGSGTDVAASAFGGVLRYEITPGDPQNAMIEPLELPENLYMLVVWTGTAASTRELVARVNAFRAREAKAYSKTIERMRQISFNGIHAIANEEIVEFMESVNEYNDAMAALGQQSDAPIITPAHARISATCRDFGTAYKPSGAGGGDMGIAFAESPEKLEALGESLADAGFQIIDVKISHRGVFLG